MNIITTFGDFDVDACEYGSVAFSIVFDVDGSVSDSYNFENSAPISKY